MSSAVKLYHLQDFLIFGYSPFKEIIIDFYTPPLQPCRNSLNILYDITTWPASVGVAAASSKRAKQSLMNLLCSLTASFFSLWLTCR